MVAVCSRERAACEMPACLALMYRDCYGAGDDSYANRLRSTVVDFGCVFNAGPAEDLEFPTQC